MPTDKRGKYHMNAQIARKGDEQEEKTEEQISPGIHEKVAEQMAHHVEIHHGGHPDGNPPMHEGHTHHTIAHHEDGSQEVTNHESVDEAADHAKMKMGGDQEEQAGEDQGNDYEQEGGGEDEY